MEEPGVWKAVLTEELVMDLRGGGLEDQADVGD
jgi:hypothetical protein